MKKYIYCALLTLLGISCSKNDDPMVDSQYALPVTLNAQSPELESRALREYLPESWDDTETVNSRTHAVPVPKPNDAANPSEYIQYWSDGDAISVFSTTQNLQYTLNGFKEGQKDVGIFTLGDDSEDQGLELTTDHYYSIYPYKAGSSINYKTGEITYNFPKTQHYIGDSYANGENGMIAREEIGSDGDLYFQNFCSYLQLRLYTNENKSNIVKQIVLTANNPNNKMSGPAFITYDGTTPNVNMKTTATNEIILDCGNGVELSYQSASPTKFWFVLPGDFTFSDGFTITVSFSDNSFIKKSTQNQITIPRSHIKPMDAFNPENEKEDIIVTGPIRYKYENGIKHEKYDFQNLHFFDKDGNQLRIINQDYKDGEWIVYLSGVLGKIGGNVFNVLQPDIESITIDSEDEIDIEGYAFYNCTAETIKIYNDVGSINASAFENAEVTYLEINGNVETLGEQLSKGSNLDEIVINGNVSTIEYQAFNSSTLTKFTVNGDDANIIIESQAFVSSDIEEFVITGDVSTIGEQAFLNCRDLIKVQVDNGIQSIDSHAFQECRDLSEIDLSEVEYIGEGAFHNCKSLEEINLNSVITIEDNAFMNCSKLTSAVISANCIMIGEGAFCNASRLQTVICNAVTPPFIKTENEEGSFIFDGTNIGLKIYIPSKGYDNYNDKDYFVNHTPDYELPILATRNWWFEEYTNKLTIIQ